MTESVYLKNGGMTPVAAIPRLEYGDFGQAIVTQVQKGQARVAAYFAVLSDEPGAVLEIFAILARERHGDLAVFRTLVGERFESLTPNCSQVHLFEREIAEQFGVIPEGHPWLKPVRFHRSWRPDHDAWGRDPAAHPLVGDLDFYRIDGDGVHEVAVGPVHAGVIEPGHFRFQCYGETVMHLEISLGYQHRDLERMLLGGPHPATPSQIETIGGDSTVAHMSAYSKVIEGLTGCPAPARAKAIRALGLELERLANHVGDLGALSGDVGFLPTASYCGRLRGDYLNMTAHLCGSRFGRGLVRPGGVLFDLQSSLSARILAALEDCEANTIGAIRLFFDTPSVLSRLEGIGRLSRSAAEDLGLVGVAAKACGVPRDCRFFFPTGIYQQEFDELITDENGDVFARARVRSREVEVSLGLVRRILGNLPKGETMIPMGPLPPESLAVTLVEGWRGEVVHVGLTDGTGSFRRYKIVDPSFHNWSGLALALRDQQISDFPLCNKSFNLSYAGFDL
ncbi:MAG: NADH-quinone oxidoreductase subunit C [Proteobacteria bacterium]|nr:NADH-quinone oxidoreductase subunit C [Pseudomonadota bacterium]MBU1687426.1 NADH-quinone oxidoreductase subunit C [Pseudomonadota bacterium]